MTCVRFMFVIEHCNLLRYGHYCSHDWIALSDGAPPSFDIDDVGA